ncbi:PEP-CTERM sorting domain-containing protein [Niveibacterium sp. SC-1]|uniref:PEP-CTERM sorting domain-containing protein n=1 Tax=Niveibacterium sp. SC-1 TaxID=3135646 RepID=UPI00311DEBEF
MSSRWLLRLIVLSALLVLPLRATAAPVVIDFESFSDLDAIGSISGATFSNATALRSGAAGGSLNQFELPPYSGLTVAIDAADFAGGIGGPMRIAFTTPVISFNGRFTYLTQLTLTAFDDTQNVLATTQSLAGSNSGVTGTGLVNELLGFTMQGIRSVEIAGGPLGFSFAVDNIAFEPQASVPEPTTLLLVGTAVAVALRQRSTRRRV